MLLTELASVWVVLVLSEGFSDVQVMTEEVCAGFSDVCATCVDTECFLEVRVTCITTSEVCIIAEKSSAVYKGSIHIYILLHHAHQERGINKEIAAIYLDTKCVSTFS